MSRALRNFEPNRCYHLTSRIAHQEFFLDDNEKTHLVELIRRTEIFSGGVKVLAYCVMSNHLHILVRLEERPPQMPTDDVFLQRMTALYGSTYAQCVIQEWKRLDTVDRTANASHAEKAKVFARMYDVSEFMRSIKQRYSMSFNSENNHTGTMWEGRFHSVAVQPTVGPMAAVAAYIDLNPIRGGVVRNLAEYPWCSFSAANVGDKLAQSAYRFIYGMDGRPWEGVSAQHAAVMMEKENYFKRASRSFVAGGAIGNDAFVGDYGKCVGAGDRKVLPKRLPGGAVWGDLRVLREKRKRI